MEKQVKVVVSKKEPQNKHVLWLEQDSLHEISPKLYNNGEWQNLKTVNVPEELLDKVGKLNDSVKEFDREVENFSSDITSFRNSLITETQQRMAVDSSLGNRINSVTTTANNNKTSLNNLESKLNTNIANLKAKDTELEAAISSETTSRRNEVDSLQDSISKIDNRVSTTENHVVGIKTAISDLQKKDEDIMGNLESLGVNDLSTRFSEMEQSTNKKLSELEGKMDGIHVNLLEGAEWEVGRIFQGSEINTTDYPNYRVFKFQCSVGDKINVEASYTPTSAFIGYIKEDNKVEVVINGTGGAIEETTIECVTATYVVCELQNTISNITTLVQVVKGLSTIVSNLESAVEVNTQDITHIQTTLEPIDKKVNGSVNTIDIKPTLEWKDGRVFTGGIDTESYPGYKYAEIECKEGDKIRIAASYIPPSSVFFGYKDGSRITQLIAGTGTGIDEQIFECIDATYVVCQLSNAISNISILEKTVKVGSEFEQLRQELTDEIDKKIEDAPIDSKQYVRKDGEWQELSTEKEEPVVTDLRNIVEWKNGRVVGGWIDTSATYSKLCEIEIAHDGDELIVASNKSGPANVSFLSRKIEATHATNVISSTDGGSIPEQKIVCEKGTYIVCIYAYSTTDVTVLTKIEYPVDEKEKEQQEENRRNRGFLFDKVIASLGDSLSTSGLWQNELVKKGAIFNAEKNYTDGQPSYSLGGTVTCDAKDANCGHIRARRLVEDGIVMPDVIFIENVNDSRLAPPPNHDTPSNIDDEPFFLTDVINDTTTYNSKQDAITAWENNFASIVGSVTAKKGVAFLLKYNVSAKVFTINSAPTQNGYIEITAAGNDVKRITLTTSDTVSTVIEKILAYDYSGWTDTKKSSGAVIFSPSITGDVDITANTCGLNFTKTTEESTNSIARCFCSVDVSKWNDETVWKENPGLFASYKGIVEYLQTAFPTAQIVFFIPETWGLNYNASTYKRADGTIDVDKIAKSYSYVGYLFTLQNQFCERYNLRVIDVRGKCGANYINISQFNAPDEVHPKNLGYQRWGEEIVRVLN